MSIDRRVVLQMLAAVAASSGLGGASAACEESFLDGIDWQAARDELRAAVRADYEAGRIVNLSGWFVSQTEASLLRDHCQ